MMSVVSRVEILVKPSKKKFRLYRDEDGRIIVELTSPPAKGKANKELLQKLTKILGCPVNLIKGQTSTTKLVEVPLTQAEVEARITRYVEAVNRGS